MSSRRFMPHPSRAANIVMRITRGVEEGNFRAWRRDTRVTARCCELAGRRSKKAAYARFETGFVSLLPFHFNCDISLSSQLRKATISRRVPFPGGLTSQ